MMQALYHSVVLQRELSRKAKLLVFTLIFVSILTLSHVSLVMNDRKSAVTNASVRNKCLRKSDEVIMFDKVRITACYSRISQRVATFTNQKISAQMAGPFKQNATNTASQTTREYAKLNEKGQLDDHEQDGLIISRILVATVWDFVQAKCRQC